MTPLPPLFWKWAAWRLGHSQWRGKGPRSKPRPAEFPWAIPPRWWREYDRRFVRPPTPPVQTLPPFAGRGIFTAWDPLSALRLAGLVDWVAVQAEGQTNGLPWTTPEIVARLKAAGFTVHCWEAAVSEGGAAVTRLGANGGYIGQNESRAQHEACLRLPAMSVPKAMVGNPGDTPEGENAWPKDWYCLAEVYSNANPQAKAENIHFEAWKRGARDISLCFGLYDAAAEQPGQGGRIALRSYLAYAVPKGLAPQGFCGYLSETLLDDDVACLSELARP